METNNVQDDHIIGWQGAKRKEQRASDAYTAGYEAGQEKNADDFSDWIK